MLVTLSDRAEVAGLSEAAADYRETQALFDQPRHDRSSISDLQNLYVRAQASALVPLSSVVTVTEIAEPGTLNRFNRLRSITISAGSRANTCKPVARRCSPSAWRC